MLEAISETYETMFEPVQLTLSYRELLLERYTDRRLAQKYHGRGSETARRLVSRSVMRTLRLTGTPMAPSKVARPDRELLVAVSLPQERTSAQYHYAVAEHWLEALADGLCRRFGLNSEMVAALTKIDNLYKAPAPIVAFRQQPRRFFAGAALVLGVVGVLITKESFEAVGWSTATYGYFTLGLALVIATALLWLFAMVWLYSPAARSEIDDTFGRAHEIMPAVLTYCAALCSLRTYP